MAAEHVSWSVKDPRGIEALPAGSGRSVCMVGAVSVRSSYQRGQKSPVMPSMPQCSGFRSRLPDRPVVRGVILLAGLIATGLLVGCTASPQSLGITGPGDQQKSPGARRGIKSQHDQPYSGGFVGTQQG